MIEILRFPTLAVIVAVAFAGSAQKSSTDNTPRSARNGLVLTGSTPEKFRSHVRSAVQGLAENEPEERLLFIKSWNEWAEGNYLEPDTIHGHGYLKVLYEELSK